VVAFGGYATFPSLIAAIILKRRIILHEQNSHLGKVNRLFAKYAKVIALSYAETLGIENKYLTKTKFTGNPIRKEMVALSEIEYHLPNFKVENQPSKNHLGYDVLLASDFNNPEPISIDNNFNILVIGGSGGARIFSEILPKAFFNIREELKNHISITQQCRKEDLPSLYTQYKSFNLTVTIKSFFNDMEERIKKAHLVIARAGSSSIAEFTAAKRPLILIPFALASDNHQEKNALFVEKMGGAILIREKDLTINKITDNIEKLIDNPELLERMSRLSFASATISATENLTKLIENLA
jgi:UDP-N-acetylglucosamine--N-acetylmuramyl-(pentapeptide) pyrophosphoryl-undecaprenol N-acetylglucosamine transferase